MDRLRRGTGVGNVRPVLLSAEKSVYLTTAQASKLALMAAPPSHHHLASGWLQFEFRLTKGVHD